MDLSPAELQVLRQLPALTPPPGVVSNFVNPTDLKNVDRVLLAICLIISTTVVALRICSKLVVAARLGIDDFFLGLSWVLYMSYSFPTIIMIDRGIGRHQWDIRIGDLECLLYYLRMISVIYCVATALVKTSILLQFINIFSPNGRRNFMFCSCWGLIIFTNAFYFACGLSQIFSCQPIRRYWQRWLPGTCINSVGVIVATGVINSITDAAIIILPQKAVWMLGMPTKQKLEASLVFLIGFIALAASVVRLYYSIRILEDADKTWALNYMGLWTYIEFTTTYLSTCLPACARLVRHWRAPSPMLLQNATDRNESQQHVLQVEHKPAMHSDPRGIAEQARYPSSDEESIDRRPEMCYSSSV